MRNIPPEAKAVIDQVLDILQKSQLTESQKYAVCASCIASVATECNTDLPKIKQKISNVCAVLLGAVKALEELEETLQQAIENN